MDNKPYQLSKLPSGLRLITVPMESTKTVTVLVMVKTGSRNESEAVAGISHFLEHLMFKGTKRRPGALDISEELDGIGADYNAFTGKEYTGYYVKCAMDKIDIALDVISDIFINSKFDQKEIEKERGAIKEEINLYLDTPTWYIGTVYENLLYGEHPLGRDIAGSKESVNAIRREHIVDYFNAHYLADNAIVAIAGNFNAISAKKNVEKYFKNIRKAKLSLAGKFSSKQKNPGLKSFPKSTDQTHINIGFRAYSYMDLRYPIMQVISTILGGGMSSRLFTEVREKRGLAYYVAAGASGYNEVGDITTRAGLNSSKLSEAVKVILKEHTKLKTKKLKAKELLKVKDYIKGKTAIRLESSDELALHYGNQLALENRNESPDEILAKIDRVSADDVMRIAKELFVPKNLNLALIGPKNEKLEVLIRKELNKFK